MTHDFVTREGGPGITLTAPRYAPTEPFQPTCPIATCSQLCDHDALWCAECGARLYTLESGRYGKQS